MGLARTCYPGHATQNRLAGAHQTMLAWTGRDSLANRRCLSSQERPCWRWTAVDPLFLYLTFDPNIVCLCATFLHQVCVLTPCC